ncbi:Peroxin-3 [Spinellus fusiger]|nr:Peroxin-3 [Spinellus fusiger]
MPFFVSVKDYVKKHQRGLLMTATFVGGGYLASRFASRKIRDLQEKATAERQAKENLKRRFQQNQNDCVFTVISLLPTLGDQILHTMNIEAAWAKLQESRQLEKREAKAQILNGPGTGTGTGPIKEHSPSDATTAPECQDISSSTVKIDLPDTATATLPPIETPPLTEPSAVVGRLDKKSKQLMWEEIKCASFTRTLTCIYSVTLLTLLTHIQLNLLGRFTYVWSVSLLERNEPTLHLQSKDTVQEGLLDSQTERDFLSVSWWILHRGWKKCSAHVEKAVEEVIGSISLRSTVDYFQAEEIIFQLRKRIEFDMDELTPTSFRSWMLPDTKEDEMELLRNIRSDQGFPTTESPQTTTESAVTLDKLMDEARDCMDSPDFFSVLHLCLDEVFGMLDTQTFGKSLRSLDHFTPIQERIREATEDDMVHSKPKTITLAKLLPMMSQQAHAIIAGKEYLSSFTYLKELQAFSALIYTHYGEEVATTE